MPRDPPENAVPVHEATEVTVPAGSRAEVEFQAVQSGTTFAASTVAVSKFDSTTYEIEADGTTRYDQSAVPPTDPDNLVHTFTPPLEFTDTTTVIIRNVGSSSRDYELHVVGWEAQGGVA